MGTHYMNQLQAVRTFGQQIWLDNLSRGLIESGELANWLADGIAGVTSNPAIFHKAIAHDPSYRQALLEIRDRITDPEARYEALVLPDIQASCDLLAPLYEDSRGEAGYVSLEVSPALAHDALGTIAAARRLWAAIARPNAMIKVPATPAGIEALSTLIAEGINVNITLLFSLSQLEATWDAYIAGLNARVEADLPVHSIRAVASFFLSRIDHAIDAQLPEALQGKTAIALARQAYRRYQARFHGAEFAPFKSLGAWPHILLWASTGTKNPAYSDVLYVESLMGAETVNTVPDATLLAFRDHGQAAERLCAEDGEHTDAQLAGVAAAGIDLEALGAKLLQDGLKSFDEAFAALLVLTA